MSDIHGWGTSYVRRAWVLLGVILVIATGCEGDVPPAGPRPVETDAGMPLPPPALTCEDAEAPVPEPLVWKRVGPLAADLAGALALPVDALCRELGAVDCREVHRVPLGGSDPIGTGLYTPPPRPMTTTPMAVDRLVLSSCAAAVERDASGPRVVLTAIDLEAASLDPDDASTRAAMDADARALYRRLLTRDATEAELAILRELARPLDGLTPSAREWALAACYAVGSSTEMLFL